MSVRIAVIGDPHVKDDNILETEKLILKLIDILTIEKPDLIVVAGDLLHSFDIAHVAPHKLCITMLRELKKIANLVLLIGNHDLSSPLSFFSNDHFFTPLYEWNGLLVADRCCNIFEVKGFKFAAVPYVVDGKFLDALSSNPSYNHQDITAIFAHQQFLGCKMDKVVSKTGDKWTAGNPLVISGHIHEHQRLADNLIYVGTPRQSSFRDSTDKTISIFEFCKEPLVISTGNQSGISNSTYWTETRISVGLPIKIKITINADQIHFWTPPPGHKIKLEILGSYIDLAAAKEHPNIKYWLSLGIVIVYLDIKIPNYNSFDFVQPTSRFTSFTTMYKEKLSGNPEYVELYDEIIEGTSSFQM